MTYHADIEKGAKRIRDLHDRIHQTYRSRSAEWAATCQEFHSSYDTLAYPGGLDSGMGALKTGEKAAVELAIQFLEVDPMFFRSGYIKEEIIQRLNRAKLSASQADQLNRIILHIVENRDCREFRRYCRMARRTADSCLEMRLRERLNSRDPNIRRRAGWVLDAIDN